MLTDCVFGAALEALQRNREALGRNLGSRCRRQPTSHVRSADGRDADGASSSHSPAAAAALAGISAGRVRPRRHRDRVIDGAGSSDRRRRFACGSRRRCRFIRVAFRSAVESQRSFVDIGSAAGSRCGGAMALQVLLRTTCGEPLNQLPVVVNAPMRPASNPPSPSPAPEEGQSPFDSILRSVFPKH